MLTLCIVLSVVLLVVMLNLTLLAVVMIRDSQAHSATLLQNGSLTTELASAHQYLSAVQETQAAFLRNRLTVIETVSQQPSTLSESETKQWEIIQQLSAMLATKDPIAYQTVMAMNQPMKLSDQPLQSTDSNGLSPSWDDFMAAGNSARMETSDEGVEYIPYAGGIVPGREDLVYRDGSPTGFDSIDDPDLIQRELGLG